MDTNIKKKLLWLGAVLALVAVLGGYWYVQQVKKNKALPQVFKFSGQVTATGQDYLVLNGVYDSKDHPELATQNQMRDVTVKINQQTQYHKTVIHLPSAQEINAQHGAVRGDQLKKDESDVNFETFKQDVTTNKIIIKAQSSQNIFDKQQFLASGFSYILAQ